MSDAIKFPSTRAHDELIRKLVRAGYLSLAKQYDPEAISQAIVSLKAAMRGYPAEDEGPRVAKIFGGAPL
jgi:hypothetical protein